MPCGMAGNGCGRLPASSLWDFGLTARDDDDNDDVDDDDDDDDDVGDDGDTDGDNVDGADGDGDGRDDDKMAVAVDIRYIVLIMYFLPPRF